MGNLLSCNLCSYRGHTERAYAHLPTIGVKHVEIGAPAPEAAVKVLGELRARGLQPATIQAFSDIGSESFVNDLGIACGVAAKLGVRVVFTSVHAGEVPVEDVYARMREAGDVAGEHGVLIAMETHPDLMTNGGIARQTIEAIGHPHVRMNFDTANIYYYNEGTTTEAELAKVAPYVASVHLKDSAGLYKTWNFPTIGRGVVRFAEVVRILGAEGFTGPYTMELEGIEGQSLNADEAAADVAASVEHLRSVAEFE